MAAITDPRSARFGQELSTAVVLFHDALGRRLGLAAADHRALTMIEAHGPLTPGRLSQLTGLTPGAVTALVDRLQVRGYVTRQHSQDDRRRVLLAATGTIPDDVTAITNSLSAEITASVSTYDAAQLSTIEHFVSTMIAALQRQTRYLNCTPERPHSQG